MKHLKLICLVFLILFGLYRGKSMLDHGEDFLQTLTPMIEFPHASYDQKMAMKYPRYYNYLLTVKNSTPPTATIYVPDPESVTDPRMRYLWDDVMTAAILYPRQVLIWGNGSIQPGSYLTLVDNFPPQSPESAQIELYPDNTGRLGLARL